MLVEALLDARNRWPGSPAVDDGHLALDYRKLTSLAAAMRGIILRETDNEKVGIMLPSSAAFPAVLFGTLWADRIAVPLNFLLGNAEIEAIIDDAGLDVVFTVRPMIERTGQLSVRTVFLENLPLKRKTVTASILPLPRPPVVHPDDTAVILYTSGTTGMPKGVELTQRNLQSNCVDAIESLGFGQQFRFLNILPPFHVFGLTGNVLVPVFLGGSTYAIPRFSPAAAIRAIEQQKIAVLLAIPSMYAAMLRTRSGSRESMSSLLFAISGGEPLSDRVRREFEERFGIVIRQGYGLTETSPIVSACSPTLWKDGTVGKPIANVRVKLIGPDQQEVQPGEDGEILVHGPGIMKGYYNKPEETRAIIDEDGWLRTGDMGRLDADGFLAITGRVKEMIIVSGENVFPREIEAVLEDHPAVLQAAVIGIPDESRGEVPIAFVLCDEHAQVTGSELRTFSRRSLAGFKVPREVFIRTELPTGPTGKVLKKELHQLLNETAPQEG